MSRGTNRNWAIAGMHIIDPETLKLLSVDIEKAKKVRWAESGCDISMITEGPGGEYGESYVRYLDKGPDAGSFEIRILTRAKEAHVLLRPLGPGVETETVCEDRTRPGSWFRYSCPVIIGEVTGELMVFSEGETPVTHSIPGPDKKAGRGYLEHMWGQSDINHFYWDMGEFGSVEQGIDLLYIQTDRLAGGFNSAAMVTKSGDLPFIFIHDPPDQFSRVIYSRLSPRKGLLYPQLVHVWACSASSSSIINMTGSILVSRHNWLSVNLYGRAGNRADALDWSRKPMKSIMDFYKGEQLSNLHPASPRSLKQECDEDGCGLEWTRPDINREKIEYWVFRIDAGSRTDEGGPIGMVEHPRRASAGEGEKSQDQGPEASPEEEEAARIEFHDPVGTSSSFYKVIPVSIPETLLHKRLQAGYPKCTGRPRLSPPEEPGPYLAEALDRSAATGFTGPKQMHAPLPSLRGQGVESFRISLQKDNEAGAFIFILEKPGNHQWTKEMELPPRFTPGVQVQSFSAVSLDPGALALAWAERSPIMDGREFTEWEVFVSFVDIESGAFRVLPVSMSEAQSVDVSLERGENLLAVAWSECSGDQCRSALEEVPIPPLP